MTCVFLIALIVSSLHLSIGGNEFIYIPIRDMDVKLKILGLFNLCIPVDDEEDY